MTDTTPAAARQDIPRAGDTPNSAPKKTSVDKVRDWWLVNLRPEQHSGIATDLSGARALRARLRRSKSLVETLSEPAVQALAGSLPFLRRDPKRLALLVQALAHVERDTFESLASRLGARKDGGPLMSEPRFGRLLRSGIDELGPQLRRALTFADGAANIRELARDLLAWPAGFGNDGDSGDETRGEAARVRWINAFYASATAEGSDQPSFIETDA